jgi:CSLREA domain-containing protein
VWFAVAIAGIATAHADTYTVNSTADEVDATPGNGVCASAGGACTLRAAVQEANAHAGADVISLPAGVYLLSLLGPGEDAAATGDLDVTQALEVNGASADTTIIDGLHADRIFHTIAALTLRDVTLRNGNPGATPGGAVYSAGGDGTIERARFEHNVGQPGGAVAQATSNLTITDSSFAANASSSDGAGFILAGAGNLSITNSTFMSNLATGNGGGFFSTSTGTVSLTNVTASNNSAANGAGALAVGFATFTASGYTADGNLAVSSGGGLMAVGAGDVSISNATVTGNASPAFASGYFVGGNVQVSGGEFSDNVATGAFGGLYVTGTAGVTVDGTTVRRNASGAGPGGGLFASAGAGTLTLANVEASDNSAGVGGGIFATSSGAVAASHVRALRNGSGTGPGGGIFVSASTTISITDSTVADNVSASIGGGIFAAATDALSLQGSTVSGNRAAGAASLGGGAYLAAGAPAIVLNTTFSGNVGDFQGGGLYAAGTFTVRNATFAGNDSPAGKSLFNAGASVTLVSTILGDAAGNHCGGAAVTSGGNNIDSDGSCALAGAGDQNVDPQLGPLADNGGPTLTHQPSPTSPALDTGAATGCPGTDQRGQSRPSDGNGDGTAACDVGAVEFIDLCPSDPNKTLPGICGCGVADSDVAQANGTADCMVNGELKARIARAKAIIAALSGDADPLEGELSTVGGSFTAYLQQFDGQLTMNGDAKKVAKAAKKAAKAIKKVTKAKAGRKLDKAKTKANAKLDAFDEMIAPQA